MDEIRLHQILDELRKPFHPSHISWKPGATKGDRAMALAYADLRAYMNRLDEVCGGEWSVAYEPWGQDRIICKLTIGGVTRSSTGEMDDREEKNDIGGTSAEAQAFKRACAMFGLGRYLYSFPSGWVEFDPSSKRFTDAAKAKLNAMLVQHYRRATERSEDGSKGSPPHQRLWGQGASAFGEDWEDGARPWLVENWTGKVQKTDVRSSLTQLSDDEKDLLADYVQANLKGLQKRWREHKAAHQPAPAADLAK
jgi:hypothetical protein